MLAQEANNHRCYGLVEFQDDISDEAIADDDVERAALARAGREVPSLEVSLKVESCLPEQSVCFLHDRIPLFRFFSDGQQTDRRIRAAENALGVNGAEPGELKQLLRG